MKWKSNARNDTETTMDHMAHHEPRENEEKATKYRCAMGCEGDKTYSHPGNCPVCNMKLMPV